MLAEVGEPDDAGAVEQKERWAGDAAALFVGLGRVGDPPVVDGGQGGIGQDWEGIGCRQGRDRRPCRRRRLGGEGEDVRVEVAEVRVGVAQLPELPAARGSPVAAIEEEDQGVAAPGSETVELAGEVGEGKVGRGGAEGDGGGFHGATRGL